jgi:hypothetical protein
MPVLILFHKIDLNVPISNFASAEQLFSQPMLGHNFYFFKTSIKIPESMECVQKVISELLFEP